MNTLHVVDCATCGETILTLTIFGEVYPRLDWEIHTERCVSAWHCHWTLVWASGAFPVYFCGV